MARIAATEEADDIRDEEDVSSAEEQAAPSSEGDAHVRDRETVTDLPPHTYLTMLSAAQSGRSFLTSRGPEGRRRLAAQSVGQSPADVVNLSKLAEGGFSRTFLITSLTVSKWSPVFRTWLRSPSTTLSPAK